MIPSIPIAPSPSIEVRGKKVSSVILHRVPPDRVEDFLELERGISRAAETFPGYQSTDVYPPSDLNRQEWVVVLQFDDSASLQRWIDSPQRAEWIAKFDKGLGAYRVKTLPDGFGSWFAGMVAEPPAAWQMVLTVVLGLYPTVMLLNIFLSPYLSRLGLAASMLVGNILSVSILQWAVMPILEQSLRPWLHLDAPNRRAKLTVGVILIAVLLAVLVAIFRQVTG